MASVEILHDFVRPEHAIAASLVTGTSHAIALFWVLQKNFSTVEGKEVVGLGWVVLGFFVLAATPVFLLFEYGLLSPLLVFVVVSFELFRTGMREEGAHVGFALVWLGYVSLMVVLGVLEFGFRQALTAFFNP